jgi:hypothetical protein
MMHNLEFTTKIYLPIIKQSIRIRTINNSHYFDILKFITNNDEEGLNDYFENLILDLIVDKSIFCDLSNLEKFLILLESRIHSIGDNLTTSSQTADATVNIPLYSMRDKIIESIKNFKFKRNLTLDTLKVNINLPKKLLLNDIDDIYRHLIDEIVIDDTLYKVSDLSNQELDSILQNLPAEISSGILNFIQDLNDLSRKLNIFDGNEKLGIQKISMGFLDNTLFYFLKNIFSEELGSFYELMYSMIKKLNFDYNSFMNVTPNECKIFINFYNSDIKREDDANRGSMGSMPNIPKPNFPKF